ncbi:MAG: hypothetical protein N2D54_06860 [Chloroflexota bacterium]
MDSSHTNLLRQALDNIKSGKLQDARKILVELLREDSEIEQAWYMLSFSVPNLDRQVYALHQTLRINPKNQKAIERIKKLSGEKYTPPSVYPKSEIKKGKDTPISAKPAQPEPPAQVQRKPLVKRKSDAMEEDLLTQRLFGNEDPVQEGEDLVVADIIVEPGSTPSDSKDKKAKKKKTKRKKKVKKPKIKRERKSLRLSRRSVILILLILVVGSVYYLDQEGIISLLPNGTQMQGGGAAAQSTPTSQIESSPTEIPITPTLVPSSTNAPVTPSETPTQFPTLEVSPSPTVVIPALPADIFDGVINIQSQVEQIRGINVEVKPDSFLVAKSKIREILEGDLYSPALVSDSEKDKRVIDLLGLASQSYSFTEHGLNKWADHYGGLYIPGIQAVYFTGLSLGDVESYAYSQAYALLLSDQEFDLVGLGSYPACLNLSDECLALLAFVKGDSALTANQWNNQFGSLSQQDQEILNSAPYFISGSTPPAFASPDQLFVYNQGSAFVAALQANGGWGRVNDAYLSPPTTTEQIMHPEKYLAAEQPLAILSPDISSILDNNWEVQKDDALGEWLTFLMLSYPNSFDSPLDVNASAQAAAGWGGDRAQVYFNNIENLTVGTYQWAWDTSEDASEFSVAIHSILVARYENNEIESTEGVTCWEGTREISCLVSGDNDTLWVIANNLEMAEKALSLYNFEP